MSQIENHWEEVQQIEAEFSRHLIALGMDWRDPAAMLQLATECKTFGPVQVRAAYATNDRQAITKAEFFALVSVMIRTMAEAARENRDVHAGQAWKAFAKHLYD